MAITPKSGLRIVRRSVAGMEGMWAKMWDPPRASPVTPDLVAPTDPVPAFMASLGLGSPSVPNTRNFDLLNGLSLTTWDNAKILDFMTFRDRDFSGAAWPGPTIRVPRGVVFHCLTAGKGPPPHTIHWHGLEPTPMNDGVGHCSMEIGQYTYQLQPQFIGTYFYHCHRNTVQHFEFGLYGMFLVEPPDAFNPSIPIIDGGPPKNVGGYPRRTAANLVNFPQFPGFIAGDPTFGVAGPFDVGLGDPRAFTVPYDVEALWVADDRDSVWSDLARDAFSFFPGGPNEGGTLQPGVDDIFPQGFFNDYNADYWFVTGVPVPAPRGGTAIIDPALVPAGVLDANGAIVPELNSGVSGMQVAVNAGVNQTVLVRCLNAAYNSIEVTFPVDVVITAWDGRALGVPPQGRYSHATRVPAGTPMLMSTARRFDALIRSATPVNGFATVKFLDSRGLKVLPTDPLLVTARIPININ